MFGREQSFPAETLRRREFGVVLLFLSVSASLREMAFVIASWSFCFTAVWGETRPEEYECCEFPAEALRRREFCFALLLLSVSAPLRAMAFVIAWWSFCITAAREGHDGRRMTVASFPQRR